MAKKGPSYNFSSVDLLLYLWDRKWTLIIVSFLAAVVSIWVSFQITPKFRSTVIMFPTTNATVSKSLLSANYGGRQSVYGFGEEEQAEQLLQILNSERIRNRIVNKYNLMEHYEIGPDEKYPYTKLYETYNSNISFRRTEFMSVLIEVMDVDPQIAADMANDIAALVDTIFNDMKRDRAIEAFKIVEHEYIEAEANVQSIKDSLRILGRLGVNDYRSQSDRYHEAYAYAVKEGNMAAAQMLERKLQVLSEYGGTYMALMARLEYETERLADLRQRYKEARVEAENALPYKFIVDSAYKAEKKAYPKKSVIVMVSTIGAFLLALILLIINDSIRERLAIKGKED